LSCQRAASSFSTITSSMPRTSHWDRTFSKSLKYLWNHPDLSQKTKEKIAYHNGKEYFQLDRPVSAQPCRKATEITSFLSFTVRRRFQF
jgi:hypothetical protein